MATAPNLEQSLEFLGYRRKESFQKYHNFFSVWYLSKNKVAGWSVFCKTPGFGSRERVSKLSWNHWIKCFAQFSCINCVKVVQVYGSLLRAPVSNFIAQLCEKENQCLESFAEF